MRKEIFANEERYHVYNRGVEKRLLFLDDQDRRKFIKNLNQFRIDNQGNALVSVAAYVLMPNHFHLLLLQRQDKGISNYLYKVCLSYSMYFNKKYQRWGSLFGGRFRAKHIENDAYLLHLTRYIHRNPIPILKGGSLERYPWSSYRHYIGYAKSDLVTDDLAIRMLVSAEGYRRFMGEFEPWDEELIEGLTIDGG